MLQFFSNRLRRQRQSDRGDSSMVSFVLIIPLFFSIIMTIVDSSVFFSNTAIMSNLTRDAARQAAIVGGPGNGYYYSKLEATYGFDDCMVIPGSGFMFVGNAVECELLNRIHGGAGLVNVTPMYVQCNVQMVDALANDYNLTSKMGQSVWCTTGWTYDGIPGSAMGFFTGLGNGGGNPLQRTREVALSEVGLSNDDVRVRAKRFYQNTNTDDRVTN